MPDSSTTTSRRSENGGVVGEWAIRDTTFEMPSGVPMKLTSSEATNTYRNNAFFVDTVVRYSVAAALPKATFRSPICLPYSSVIRSNTTPGARFIRIFGEPIPTTVTSEMQMVILCRRMDSNITRTGSSIPTQTRDSIYERVISNRVFIQAQPWDRNGVVGTVERRRRTRPAHLFAVRGWIPT